MKVPFGGLPELAHAPGATRYCCEHLQTCIRGPKWTSGWLAHTQCPPVCALSVCFCMYWYVYTCIRTYHGMYCGMYCGMFLVCIVVCPPWGGRLQRYVSSYICKIWTFVQYNTYRIHTWIHTNTTIWFNWHSCGSIGMYHEVFALKTCQYKPRYIPIPPQHARRRKWTERIIARICMYWCTYLYVLVCIWYVLVCIKNLFDTRVCGEVWWYWYVLGMYLPVFWYVFTRIVWSFLWFARICPYWRFRYC